MFNSHNVLAVYVHN